SCTQPALPSLRTPIRAGFRRRPLALPGEEITALWTLHKFGGSSKFADEFQPAEAFKMLHVPERLGAITAWLDADASATVIELLPLLLTEVLHQTPKPQRPPSFLSPNLPRPMQLALVVIEFLYWCPGRPVTTQQSPFLCKLDRAGLGLFHVQKVN